MLSPVIANGFPKSGTNLLASLLDLLGYRQISGAIASSLLHGRWSVVRTLFWGSITPHDSVMVGLDFPVCIRASQLVRKLKNLMEASYITAHCGYSSHLHDIFRQSGAKIIQVIRDPRDIAVSHAIYCAETPSHPLFPHYQSLGFTDQLSFSINGGRTANGFYLEDLRQRILGVDGWRRHKDILTVRFEDLVGERGGGSAKLQGGEIGRVAQFVGLPSTAIELDSIQAQLFGSPGRTFRRGQIGAWRECFEEQHLSAYQALAGEIASEWGYPIDG